MFSKNFLSTELKLNQHFFHFFPENYGFNKVSVNKEWGKSSLLNYWDIMCITLFKIMTISSSITFCRYFCLVFILWRTRFYHPGQEGRRSLSVILIVWRHQEVEFTNRADLCLNIRAAAWDYFHYQFVGKLLDFWN